MGFLTNLNIGPRLGVAFLVPVVLLGTVAAVGMSELRAANGHIHTIVHDNVRKMALADEMSEQVHIVSRILRTVVLLSDEAAIAAEQRNIEQARARYDKAYSELEKLPASDAVRAIRAKIDAARAQARAVNDQVMELARANKDAEAVKLMLEQAAPKVAAWQDALHENAAYQQNANETAYEVARTAETRSRILLISLTGLAIVLSVVIGWLITRSITAPVGQAVSACRRIRDGDLTVPLTTTARDEIGAVLSVMGEMQASLAKVVGEVRGNADSLATASAQIAQGNADLSQRTEEQASALQQTAATMEQLGITVKQNADNAQQASQLAHGASEVAVKGGDVVGRVVETMKGISDSSKKIAEIIATIDGIAFQTNILALNAAVEAARAGEQGRGFAVVAAEVRTLAQRSGDAAKQIRSLITASVERVDQGTALVDQAGETMDEIVASVRRVSDIVAEISAASVEQSSGVSQVGGAVGQMDQVTQQNAALVEESAAAAESLQAQAQQLVKAVSVFKTGQVTRMAPDAIRPAVNPPKPAPGGPARASHPAPAAVVKRPVEPLAATAATAAAGSGKEDWASF